jgi:hypothetical protein
MGLLPIIGCVQLSLQSGQFYRFRQVATRSTPAEHELHMTRLPVNVIGFIHEKYEHWEFQRYTLFE